MRNRPYDTGNLPPMDAMPVGRDVMLLETDVVKQMIDTQAAVTYIGCAECGSASTDAKWQIQRVTVAGTVETIEWADGDGKFDNIFDNRAALTYK